MKVGNQTRANGGESRVLLKIYREIQMEHLRDLEGKEGVSFLLGIWGFYWQLWSDARVLSGSKEQASRNKDRIHASFRNHSFHEARGLDVKIS